MPDIARRGNAHTADGGVDGLQAVPRTQILDVVVMINHTRNVVAYYISNSISFLPHFI